MAWLNSRKRHNKKTGRKETYWSIAWRDETGKTRTRAIGFCRKPEARRMLKVLDGKLAAGEEVSPPEPTSSAHGSTPPARVVPTLADYLDLVFLPVVRRDKAPKTYETTRTSANALISIMGGLRLDEVSYAVADAYISRRKKLGRRSRTIILELRCLKQALQHAADCEVISHVPKLPRLRDTDRKPHRYLTEAESVALLNALRPFDQQPHRVTKGRPPIPRDRLTYLAILMALNTGMRRNEILTRTWDDILWNQGPYGVLLVRAKPGVAFLVKTRRDRSIPLTPELREELLKAFEAADRPSYGWVFPSPRNPANPRGEFKKALRSACERAGLPPIHTHGLRHTWASRLAMAGVDRKTLMELGGWKEGRMLDEVYAHVTDRHMAEVMSHMGISAAPSTTGLRVLPGGSSQEPDSEMLDRNARQKRSGGEWQSGRAVRR